VTGIDPEKHDNDQFGLEQPWNAKFKFLILFDQLSLNDDDGKINEKRARRGSLTDRFPTRKDFQCFMVRNFFWSAETYFPQNVWVTLPFTSQIIQIKLFIHFLEVKRNGT
jgi:hypothetical protein